MTFLVSMLFIVAITFSLLTISASFQSSWAHIIQIIERETSEKTTVPNIRVGEAKYASCYQDETISYGHAKSEDNIVIVFPHYHRPTPSNEALPKAA